MKVYSFTDCPIVKKKKIGLGKFDVMEILKHLFFNLSFSLQGEAQTSEMITRLFRALLSNAVSIITLR